MYRLSREEMWEAALSDRIFYEWMFEVASKLQENPLIADLRNPGPYRKFVRVSGVVINLTFNNNEMVKITNPHRIYQPSWLSPVIGDLSRYDLFDRSPFELEETEGGE